jgi:F-type H+-transporting ATPase subunit gamma
MAAAKEIRTQIRSIANTQKITRAMEMVAASKMRRAMDRMNSARPYALKMRQVISHIGNASSEYRHAFMEEREVKRIGVILVTTDRGLCGGLNTNLFRQLVPQMQEWTDKRVEMDFCAIGNKGVVFLRRIGANVVAQATHLGDEPQVEDLIGVVKVLLDKYEAGEIDELYVAFNDFVNSMTQNPAIERMLPLVPAEDDELSHHWDYIYEPDAQDVLENVFARYLESLVYQAVVENYASEQAARMVAMKAASDNAGKLIDELNLVYNKARQAAITQELSEIVGGAAAV